MSGLAICSDKKLWHAEEPPAHGRGALFCVEGLLDFWAGTLVGDE